MASKFLTRTLTGVAATGLLTAGLLHYSNSKNQSYVASLARSFSTPPTPNMRAINFRDSLSPPIEMPSRIEVYVDTSQDEVLFGPRTTSLSHRPSFTREEFALFATGTDTVRIGSENSLAYHKIQDTSSVESYTTRKNRPIRRIVYERQ